MPGYSSVTPSGGIAYVPESHKKYTERNLNTQDYQHKLKEHTFSDRKIKRIINKRLKAQRQSDLKKLSFHLGVDVKTLEGYLQSKERL